MLPKAKTRVPSCPSAPAALPSFSISRASPAVHFAAAADPRHVTTITDNNVLSVSVFFVFFMMSMRMMSYG